MTGNKDFSLCRPESCRNLTHNSKVRCQVQGSRQEKFKLTPEQPPKRSDSFLKWERPVDADGSTPLQVQGIVSA